MVVCPRVAAGMEIDGCAGTTAGHAQMRRLAAKSLWLSGTGLRSVGPAVLLGHQAPMRLFRVYSYRSEKGSPGPVFRRVIQALEALGMASPHVRIHLEDMPAIASRVSA